MHPIREDWENARVNRSRVAEAAIDFIESEAANRSDLALPQTSLRRQHESVCPDLFAADGSTDIMAAEIRTQAKSLVLRAVQSAMVAAKGAGFVTGHPVGRWCRDALFFLAVRTQSPRLIWMSSLRATNGSKPFLLLTNF